MQKVTEFITSHFDNLAGGIGPWLAALLILILGYIVAKFIAKIASRAFYKAGIDQKLGKYMPSEGGSVGASQGLGKFVFILIMLFVLVAVMRMINLPAEVTAPITGILEKVMGFIPNLLSAGILLVVAILIATVVKMVLSGLLGALDIDRRLHIGEGNTIANAVSGFVYFMIIILFLPGVFEVLNLKNISTPIIGVVNQITGYIPTLLTGVIIFSIGLILARIVQKMLGNLLVAVGTDTLPEKLGYRLNLGRPLSSLISTVAMVIILVITTTEALKQLKLPFISEISESMLEGSFGILGGLLIFGIGFFLANWVYKQLASRNRTLASITRGAIIVLAAAMALQRANIAPEITSMAFRSVIVALAVALGVGGAIALGYGGRDAAKRLTDRWI